VPVFCGMSKIVKPLVLGAALLTLLPAGAAAGARSDALATIDAAIPDALKKGFGGVILIEERGRPIFEKSYGFADRER